MITAVTLSELKTDPKWRKTILENLNLPFNDSLTQNNVFTQIEEALNSLKDELMVVIETNYVDKDYRDGYYHYFATKIRPYHRDGIRLSFFDPSFNFSQLKAWDDFNAFLHSYKGFMILRPLIIGTIGRNVIAPDAKTNFVGQYRICVASVRSSCYGIKLKAVGFPHSSQDSELMTCAETTIWSIMQYFGNKYPEYKPETPFQIIDSLKQFAIERQTPSTGLPYMQVSAALMAQGFGCKVYSSHNCQNFKELLCCYIESGIPLAIALTGPGYGHAVVGIGRTDIPRGDALKGQPIKVNNKNIFYLNQNLKEIVVNNDNVPSYQIMDYATPVPSDKSVTISTFIAPLYPKIYMEADMAICYSNFIITYLLAHVEDGSTVKTFLTSSRSYRQYIALNPDLDSSNKEELLDMEFPKFVWVTEIAGPASFLKHKVNSLILADATSTLDLGNPLVSLLYIRNNDVEVFFDKKDKEFKIKSLSLHTEIEEFKGNII